MIQIKAPDGSIAQFPDGTPDETIKSVMAKHYPPPVQSQPKDELIQRGAEGGPVAAFGNAAANTFGLNIPRALGAAAATGLGGLGVPGFSEAWQRGYRGNYDLAKQQDEALAAANPKANAAGVGAGIVGQIAAAPVTGPATAAGRLGMGAAVGGTMGAVSEGLDKGTVAGALQGGALGAAGGYAGGALGEAAGAALGSSAAKKVAAALAPSAEAMGGKVKDAYGAMRDAGVWYAPDSAAKFVGSLKTKLSEAGIEPDLQPQTAKAVAYLEKRVSDGKAITLDALDNVRKAVGNAMAPGMSKADKRGLYMVQEAIDNFAETGAPIFANARPADSAAANLARELGADHVTLDGASSASETLTQARDRAVAAMKEGRAAYAANARASSIDQAIKAGTERAQTTGSGANVDNAIRQELRKVIKYARKDKDGNLAGWSRDEEAALRDAAYGRGSLRLVGKLAPTGVVSAGGSAMLGAALGGPVGSAVTLGTGAVAKALADRGTRKSTEYAANLARTRVVPGAAAAMDAARRKALTRSSLVSALAGASVAPAIGPR